MTGLFITGTDTDAGKTVITAGLLRALRLMRRSEPLPAGCPVWVELAVKAVQTGVVSAQDPFSDSLRYIEAVADLPGPEPITLRSFRLAASPHLAAARENVHLRVDDLVRRVGHQRTAHPHALMVLEGAGGVLVPLNDTETMLDLMVALGLPVLVVMGNRLGAMNHTLLTVRAIAERGLTLAGVVASHTAPLPSNPDELAVIAENVRWLREHAGVPALWELPYEPALDGSAQRVHVSARLQAWDRVAAALHPLARSLWQQAKASATARCSEPVPTHSTKSLAERDSRVLWHPYASTIQPLPVYEAQSANGTRIRLTDGREVVDGMASWWCAVHGYGHPRLVQAAKEQAECMSHVMFGGLTHEPAVLLAERLFSLAPAGLARVFFADSGSVSVEVALKMALQYHRAAQAGGTRRTRILTPLGGYHGDTFGAMSVCDPDNGMHHLFRGLLAEQLFIPRPACRFPRPSCHVQYSSSPEIAASLAPMEAAFAEHGPTLAAMILEPVVQGAGGMWFYHPEYLKRARALCDEHGVLLILDEIATGFGRTGRFFAAEWAGISPDILCCGKALTGGMLSFAATLCTEAVANGVCANGHVLMHGPTFMANPLACRVALASLDILETEDWAGRVAALESGLRQGLAPCADLPGVVDVRVLGGIGVVECKEPVNVARLQRFFVDRGVWIRPFNRLIYLMPPYVADSVDLQRLTSSIHAAILQGVHQS